MALSMEDTSYRLVKSEVRELTRELAEEFRNLDPSPTERELNPARIRHLKMKAEAGQLVTFHWSVARLGDKRLRMNGQHSSNMLCGLNGHFPKDLKVHIDEYEVPNKASLALLFRQFDDRKSNRSPSDVAGAYQGLYEELHDVPRGPAKMAVEGACWYDRHVEGLPSVSGDDQYVRFGEPGLHGFIRWVGDEVLSIKTPEQALSDHPSDEQHAAHKGSFAVIKTDRSHGQRSATNVSFASSAAAIEDASGFCIPTLSNSLRPKSCMLVVFLNVNASSEPIGTLWNTFAMPRVLFRLVLLIGLWHAGFERSPPRLVRAPDRK